MLQSDSSQQIRPDCGVKKKQVIEERFAFGTFYQKMQNIDYIGLFSLPHHSKHSIQNPKWYICDIGTNRLVLNILRNMGTSENSNLGGSLYKYHNNQKTLLQVLAIG